VNSVDIAISAATEKPIRLKAAEAALRGAALDEAALKRAGEAAAEEAETIDDARGSAAYKKHLVRVQVARAVGQAAARAAGGEAEP
jgi:carbon-monoxide dehydrogenase medium subunit